MSFFKKLLNKDEPKPDPRLAKGAKSGPPPGLQTMGATLQKKFARGVQYNMKIVIKGDRNVGKSCLFQRLQGDKFKEEYIPTEEIQVASIQWSYKATDDIVKVEVWDVVDKGKKKKKIEGLKMVNSDQEFEDACLDAEFVDVYKATHGVIMILDITKQWTFDYVERELAKVPAHIPVLILANHMDMAHHRTVNPDKVKYYIEELHRGENGAQVKYCEASMRNGFGLKYVHKFFNLPFLYLQRESLVNQLETNRREIELTLDELSLHEDSDDNNYELFTEQQTAKRRQQAEKLAADSLKDAKPMPKPTNTSAGKPAATEPVTPTSKGNGATTSAPVTPAVTPTADAKAAPFSKPSPPVSLSLGAKSAPATPTPTPTAENKPSGSFMSRLFSRNKDKEVVEVKQELPSPIAAIGAKPVSNVDDFVPEEGLDASFLDDTKDTKTHKLEDKQESDSDDDGVAGNPMVAGFVEDVDSEDDEPASFSKSAAPLTTSQQDVDLSSDEEEKIVSSSSNPVITRNVDKTPSFKAAEKNSASNVTQTTMKMKTNGSHGDTHNNKTSTLMGRDSNQEESLGPSEVEPSTVRSERFPLDVRVNGVKSTGDSDDSEESDTSSSHQVAILQDTEDVSEDETVASSKQADSGVMMDSNLENSGTPSPTQPLGLEFQDLSVLESGFNFNTGIMRVESVGSSLSVGNKEDSGSDLNMSNSTRKKKKHKKEKNRDKGNENEHSSHHHKKKKKHKEREKDRELSDGDTSAATLKIDDANKKSKKKSKKKEEKQEKNELEEFLGSDIEVGVPAEGYQSL